MTSIRRANRQLWIVGLVLALGILLVTLPLYLNSKRVSDLRELADTQKKNLQCVTDWANATAARSQRIVDLSNAKNAAQDAINRALAAVLKDPAHITPAEIRALQSASSRYLAASNEYNIALKLHPLPASPQLACGNTPKASPSAVVVTQTAPGASVTVTMTHPAATQTVGVPQPTTVTAPGAARPGRTVTVTRTRTVTRTVSPPSCLTKLMPPCVLTIQK